MKKVSRENLDALFAAIAEAKKLYLPVADATDKSLIQAADVVSERIAELMGI